MGDAAAEAELIECVYAELERLAAGFMRREREGHTLQPTALVHEAFMRLTATANINFTDRNHFFAVAAQVMRRLLVDHARKHLSLKHGGGAAVPLDEHFMVTNPPSMMLQELDRALDRLASSEPRQAKVVEMRYFGGMSEDEIAAHLKISVRTVKRDWSLARATLYGELAHGAGQ
jgi:RNA polymerase sigma factor (TIGR02999 family)